jgi:hypothetical protein
MTARTYTLLGQDRRPYQSATPGALGGYRPCAVCLPDQYAPWKSAGRPRVQATAQALGVFTAPLAALASAPLQPPPSAL